MSDWKKEKPNIDGFYWYRETQDSEPEILEVWGKTQVAICGSEFPCTVEEKQGEWFGPLEPPKTKA